MSQHHLPQQCLHKEHAASYIVAAPNYMTCHEGVAYFRALPQICGCGTHHVRAQCHYTASLTVCYTHLWASLCPREASPESAPSLSQVQRTYQESANAHILAKKSSECVQSKVCEAYPVMWLHPQEQRWHHGHCFLPSDAASFIFALEQFMNLCQNGQFPELPSGEAQVPCQLIRVPG